MMLVGRPSIPLFCNFRTTCLLPPALTSDITNGPFTLHKLVKQMFATPTLCENRNRYTFGLGRKVPLGLVPDM